MNSPAALVVTGTGPFSLGEEIVLEVARSHPNVRIIGIDIQSNPLLQPLPQYRHITADLNPIGHIGGLDRFAQTLNIELNRFLDELEAPFIANLIQSAGVYDAGPFLGHDAEQRIRLVGVNLLGHFEVLHTVMNLNLKRGIQNGESLTYMEVGSFQALYPRRQRSLYAASKAATLDLCTALSDGRELDRCIYLAPGLIDTHMLHRNHWVQKSRGSPEFFESVFKGPRDEYCNVFQSCNLSALRKLTASRPSIEDDCYQAFQQYIAIRSAAFAGTPGVLSSKACAQVALRIVKQSSFDSGLYFITHSEGRERTTYSTFSKLVRGSFLQQEGHILDI